MRKLLFILLIFMLSTIWVTAQSETFDASYNALVLEHDGQERTAHLYVPEGEIQGAMIALHTILSSARAMEGMTGLNTIADERGWVIVYPEALQLYWDDGRTSVDLPPNNGAVDDSGYLASLADYLRDTYAIEDVYLTGHMQGGTMALRALCDYPTAFDGVAIVSALMWSYQTETCAEQTGTNLLFIKGTDDHIYWDETRVIGQNTDWTLLGVVDSYRFWANQFVCDTPVASSVEGSVLGIASCENDYQVAFLPIIGVGNTWVRRGENSLNNVGLETAEIIAAFVAQDDNWETTAVQQSLIDTLPRSYITYVPPSYDPTTPTPVVISLHGRGANNISQALSSGWNEVADEHGFIVAYPQAYDANFNDPQQADAVWFYERGNPIFGNFLQQNDDVFLDNMIAELSSLYNVDATRLYVNGLSNGGYMTHRLACTRSDTYAAFASMAANAPYGVSIFCDEVDVQSPILIYHGTSDTISPWDGATFPFAENDEDAYMLAPIPNTVAFWLDQNGCSSNYAETDLPNDDSGSRVVHVSYTDCPEDGAVELYAVINGGHVWHGVRDFESDFLGEVNMDVNASEIIWEFYSQFTLDGRIDTESEQPEPDRTGIGFPDISATINTPFAPQDE
ncbi:MAG: alpha/beta fold hydrolase [Chloroflexota bacterium]